MARTVEEIKKDMTAEFMKMEAVKSRYGLDGSKSFADCFSMASLENIIFYVFAVAVWALEKLFDLHRADVDARIEQLEPHTLRWYVSKAKAYMQGRKLVTDCDYYDTEGMTEQDIAAAKVVKYAVATESNTVVYIKVAREVDGNPAALTAGQLEGLTSYMNEIKDAGVSVQLRNEPADQMRISLLIYYDPTLLIIDANGNGSQNGKDPVRETTKQVIENLPFNGMFRKSDLMAALQALPCVEVADIKSVKVKPRNGAEWQTV
ncbi:hypothetical protein, partial [uncultured Alistipes sp.]|uniref:hypothetical protein n=1 Tax=uncultured Alistipes sp. TaxID=538949 RepID=UPI0026EF665D